MNMQETIERPARKARKDPVVDSKTLNLALQGGGYEILFSSHYVARCPDLLNSAPFLAGLPRRPRPKCGSGKACCAPMPSRLRAETPAPN